MNNCWSILLVGFLLSMFGVIVAVGILLLMVKLLDSLDGK